MDMKVECVICLGSNHNAGTNLDKAGGILEKHFPGIKFGEPVRTLPEGPVKSSDYLNQAARFTTGLAANELTGLFKRIEQQCGRTPQSKSEGIIPLDIDLLIYGDVVVKPQDMEAEYVRICLSGLR